MSLLTLEEAKERAWQKLLANGGEGAFTVADLGDQIQVSFHVTLRTTIPKKFCPTDFAEVKSTEDFFPYLALRGFP